MTGKILRRIIIFGLIVIILLVYLNMVYTYPSRRNADLTRERYNTFYSLPDNTVDGIILGTSGADRYLLSSVAWKEKGFTFFPMSSGHQPLFLTKFIIKEALKSQDLKAIVIEVRNACSSPAEVGDADVRRVLENMRFSLNRLQATKYAMDYLSELGCTTVDTSDLSHYFTLAKYHSRWREMKLRDYTKLFPKSRFLGFLSARMRVYTSTPEPVTTVTNETKPIDKDAEAVMNDLMDYCETLDANVVFIASPQSVDKETQKMLNYTLKLAADRGFDTINFNTEEMYKALDWDFNTDFYSKNHANFFGAVKFTRYLSDYLMEKYDIADRRNDSDQSQYQDFYDGYANCIKKLKKHEPEYCMKTFGE